MSGILTGPTATPAAMAGPIRPGGLLAGRTDAGGALSWGGGVATDAEIFSAAFEQMRLVENTTASHEALVTAYEDWRREIRATTGEEPPDNPMLYIRDEMPSGERLWALLRHEFTPEMQMRAGDVDSKRAEFQDWVNARARTLPAEATRSWAQRSPDQAARQLARGADSQLGQMLDSNPNWGKYVTAFAGGGVGALRDPLVTGTLMFGGGAGAAKTVSGRILTVAASEALLNGAVTAATQPWVQDWRRRAGLSSGFDEAAQNVLFAAGFGGVFGAVGGGIGEVADGFARSRAGKQTQRALQELAIADPELGDTARRALACDSGAAAELLGEVREQLPPAVRGALDAIEVRRVERQQLEAAYGTVLDNPTGPARDPLVEITPDDLDKLIVARGSFKQINELDVSSRAGWGLVKVLWRHGEASTEPPEFQIRRENITGLPDVVRDWRPSRTGADGRWREWRVIADGRVIVYADAMMEDGHHLVTAYVERPAQTARYPMSERKEGGGSSQDVFRARGDTGQALSRSGAGGRPGETISQLSEADKAAEIARQQERRHEVLLQRAAEAERLGQVPDLVLNDPVRVNRLVRELAPRAESIGGELGEARDFTATIADLRNPGRAAEQQGKRPVLGWVRGLGGVRPGTRMAEELNALGINARTAPGLFSKTGRQALDNMPASELPPALRDVLRPEGETGYVREQDIIDAIDAEWRAGDETTRGAEDQRRWYEENGVDFETMSDAEIRAQMEAIADAERRFLAAEPNDLGLSTDEVAFLPPGATRRAYTADVVSQVLHRLGAGVSDDVVKMAADTHIVAGESLEDAIDFAVSQAAGTPRNPPPSQFADLPSDPPVPAADAAQMASRAAPAEGEADPDAIDWAALEEEGFGSGAEIPYGDDLVSLEALKQDLDEAAWLERVVEACKL
jgi:hypothetical protein